ncbi:MAG: c-type cytochrome [Gammaproteobacteria bacterium]|nr:c-type cytochrome [Gammaproteobacteria bacterium]
MKKLSSVLLVLLMATGSAYAAGDKAAGKTKAAACIGCHGAAGISNNPVWPNLAGQKAAYITKQLKAFKAGSRKDPLMDSTAKGLSDADIENLAVYFSSLK